MSNFVPFWGTKSLVNLEELNNSDEAKGDGKSNGVSSRTVQWSIISSAQESGTEKTLAYAVRSCNS